MNIILLCYCLLMTATYTAKEGISISILIYIKSTHETHHRSYMYLLYVNGTNLLALNLNQSNPKVPTYPVFT